MNMRKSLVFIFLFACIVFSGWDGSRFKAEAASRTNLLAKIRTYTSASVLKTNYADFDGNGTKELFAVTGAKEGSNQVWYAGDKQVKAVYKDGASIYAQSPGVCTVSAKQKIMVFESGGYGSGSTSLCYYVKKGKAVKVRHAGEGLRPVSGKNFVIYPSAFDASSDGTGHTWKAYYLKWTGSGFKEYTGKKITLAKLKSYQGASAYLKQIQTLGYRIGTIFYRSNGIINVNLKKTSSRDAYDLYNVTFRVKGKKITLKVCNKKGKDIVEKSNYYGVYRAKGF